MGEYLDAYARVFGLKEKIVFGTQVTDVTFTTSSPPPTHPWAVSTTCGSENVVYEARFVVIASGVFSAPSIPPQMAEEMPGSTASVIHSKAYTSGKDQARGKKVLVVGSSLTAIEVAANAASHNAESVTLLARSPTWVLPRVLPPTPDSADLLPLDLFFYTRNRYTRPTPEGGVSGQALAKNTFMASLCGDQNDLPCLAIPEEIWDTPINVAISDDFVPLVREDKIHVLRGSLTGFVDGSHSVRMEVEECGEREEEFDLVVLATGYETDLSFLNPEIQEAIAYDPSDTLQPLVLYEGTIHPDYPSLFFVGVYKGPYFAVLELQATWAARVFSGHIELPEYDRMMTGLIDNDLAIRTSSPRLQFPHPDYVRFADTIATHAGLLDLKGVEEQDPDAYARLLDVNIVCSPLAFTHRPDPSLSEHVEAFAAHVARLRQQASSDLATP